MDQKSKRNRKNQQRVDQTQMQYLVNFQVHEQEQPDIGQVRRFVNKPSISHMETTKRQRMYMKSKFQYVTLKENCKGFDSQLTIDEKSDCIQWDDVMQVIFPTSQGIVCPICMNDETQLVAPQITTCGHIYCYPCYLRHCTICTDFEVSRKAKTKNKCPFCGEIALHEDLRSVHLVALKPNIKGAMVTLTRLLKLKGSPQLYLAETLQESPEFARLIYVNRAHLKTEVIDRELAQLNQCVPETFLFECVSSQELDTIPFIDEAILLVQAKEAQLKCPPKEEPIKYHQKLPPSQLANAQTLYQESQGQLEYLHPICNKYIMRSFEGNLPKMLDGEIIAIDSLTINENNKQRYKFLQHLPIYTEVKFIEIDLYDMLERRDYNDFYDEIVDYRNRQHDRNDKRQVQSQRKTSKTSSNNPISSPQVVTQFGIPEIEQFPDLPGQRPFQIHEEDVKVTEPQVQPIKKPSVEDFPELDFPSLPNTTPIQTQFQEPEKQAVQPVFKVVPKQNQVKKEEPQQQQFEIQQVTNKKGKKKKTYLIPTGFTVG